MSQTSPKVHRMLPPKNLIPRFPSIPSKYKKLQISYQSNMKIIFPITLAAALFLSLQTQAATLLSTDFASWQKESDLVGGFENDEAFMVNTVTQNGFDPYNDWTTQNGVTGSDTILSTAGNFVSNTSPGDSTTHLIGTQNTGSGGIWTLEFTFDVGAQAVNLTDIAIDLTNFQGGYIYQTGDRTHLLTATVFDSSFTSSLGSANDTQTATSSASNPSTAFSLVYGTAVNLNANTTYGIRLSIDETNDAGGLPGLDTLSLNGSVVPEPSSFALLAGCFGFAWVMLRRR